MKVIAESEKSYAKKLTVGTICGLGTAIVTSPLSDTARRVTSGASALLGFLFADEICDAAEFVGMKIAEKISKEDEKIYDDVSEYDDENVTSSDFGTSDNSEA